MVIDTSALVAILFGEAEQERFNEAIEAAPRVRVSAATLVETAIVIESRTGSEGIRDLEHFVARAGIEEVPLDAEHRRLAQLGFRRFGKGRHRAGLNLGDCFSYGLAMALDEPLLFKGGDFGRTDVRPAVGGEPTEPS